MKEINSNESFFVEKGLHFRPKNKVTKLVGDASTRIYYRLESENETSIICEVGNDKKVFEDFCEIQRTFKENDILVPDIKKIDRDRGQITQQDLGDLTLLNVLSVMNDDKEEFRLYLKALNQLIKIHKIDTKGRKLGSISKREFSAPKYLEEINLTLTHLYERWLGVNFEKDEKEKIIEGFKRVLNKIPHDEKVVCHRDYHSKNLMSFRDHLYVIDFQDSRLGPPQYDLVSLLEDCYYQISDDNKEKLKKHYWNSFFKKKFETSYDLFLENYDLMTIQRVFKAIGSFAYLNNEKGQDRYLKYIGFGMEKLKIILLKYPQYNELRKKLFKFYYGN